MDALISITWTVNGTSSANKSFKAFTSSHNIEVIDAGTLDTTLIIPAGADPALNGTVVKCHAFGTYKHALYNETCGTTLYIQGSSIHATYTLVLSPMHRSPC